MLYGFYSRLDPNQEIINRLIHVSRLKAAESFAYKKKSSAAFTVVSLWEINGSTKGISLFVQFERETLVSAIRTIDLQ